MAIHLSQGLEEVGLKARVQRPKFSRLGGLLGSMLASRPFPDQVSRVLPRRLGVGYYLLCTSIRRYRVSKITRNQHNKMNTYPLVSSCEFEQMQKR